MRCDAMLRNADCDASGSAADAVDAASDADAVMRLKRASCRRLCGPFEAKADAEGEGKLLHLGLHKIAQPACPAQARVQVQVIELSVSPMRDSSVEEI